MGNTVFLGSPFFAFPSNVKRIFFEISFAYHSFMMLRKGAKSFSLGLLLSTLLFIAMNLTDLFGNIISVTTEDVILLATLTAALIIGAIVWLKPIIYLAFDRDFARSAGVNTTVIGYIMAVVIAVSIVLSIRVMGIILLISLMTIPTVIATTFSKNYGKITLYASAIAAIGALAGVVISYYLEVPSGPAIIFVLTLVLIIVKLLSLQRKTATKS